MIVGMSESLARDEICRVGKSLFDRGYVHASAGNISVQLDQGFLITPSDAVLGFLDPARIALVDQQGRLLAGDPPSKTLLLHRAIYRAQQRAGNPVGCIIHTHSTYCVALSLAIGTNAGTSATQLASELLPPITPYFVMKVGHVPHVPYHRPGDPAVALLVEKLIAQYAAHGLSLHAVMLERLGPNVWHQNPAQAMAVLEELEETAKLFFLMRSHPVAPLDSNQLQTLCQNFSASW
jgi:3-dehydro-4-phosphotetronate decarboxylase